MWQAYCSSLVEAPLPTKAATGIVGTFIGDLIAQYLAYYSAPRATATAAAATRRSSGADATSTATAAPPSFEYDAARCARLCTFSALIGTPLSHYWYILLDASVLPATPTAPLAVAAKVLLDQGLQTPFGMLLFFGSLKLMEGKPGQAVPEVKSKVRAFLGAVEGGAGRLRA